MMTRSVWFIVSLACCLAGPSCHALAAAAPTRTVEASAAEIRSIGMTDQDGNAFKLGDALGRTMVLNFIFTGCGDVCPTQTAELADIQRQLPAELQARVIFVSVSIDPEHDLPGTLRHYGETRNVDFASTRFLTGSPAAIDRVVGFFEAPRPPGADAPTLTQHEGVIHLIDAKGQGRMRYRGAPLDAARLAQDIATFAAADLSAR